MKLAPLLSQFLYSHKRLDLPGIGSFMLNELFIEEPDNKQGKPVRSADISFESNPSLKNAPDLIQYISSQTGKIKALAAADLDSHLNLVQQFLNIGKPFLLEGIGSLVKLQSGEFAFSSGEVLPEKLKDYTAKEISSTSSTEQSFSNYKKPINRKSDKNWRKPVVVLLIFAGVGLAVWGGYTVYKITTSKNKKAVASVDTKKEETPKKEETVLVPDTSTTLPVTPKDTVEKITLVPVTTPAGNFRFVLEVANAKRAFERFGRLKQYKWAVQMESVDSVRYKLFMILPVAAADTTRVLDSLSVVNGKKVYIE